MSTPSKGRILVFGILFWYPLAGVTYQFLHYLLALKRLGYDVYYVEDSGRWVYDPRTNDLSPDASGNVASVAPVLEQYGFANRWAFREHRDGGRTYGMSQRQLTDLYRTADAFLNITAAQELREEHLAVPRRIYIESDPFPAQVKAAAGDAATRAMLDGHDVHFTFGERVGTSDCSLPDVGVAWLPTRQPVVTDLWALGEQRENARFTTITTWHNKGKNLEFRGEVYYWTKDREFAHVLDLPRLRSDAFELAVGASSEVHAMLRGHGWHVTSSADVSRTTSAYRNYIVGSRGEFTVARDQYVRPRTGWFSDRSACYLAAGRPVITQETGFSDVLPTGKGLFSFRNLDDVLAAVDSIASDYAGHSRAARDIAVEYFEAEKVVAACLAAAGL